MTVQVGWIGKERPVNAIVPVFESAEKRDVNECTNVVRNTDGQSFLALAYMTNRVVHSYDYLGRESTLLSWSHQRLLANPVACVAMATQTRADPDDFEFHSKVPATTVRESGEYILITSTTGYATECANRLGLTEIKGDTEDIADWVTLQGYSNLEDTVSRIADIPCGMNMVFTLLERGNPLALVYIMRSILRPGGSSRPYLHYYLSDNDLVYASLQEEAALIENKPFIPVPNNSVISLKLVLTT